jgi:hypothetical protein
MTETIGIFQKRYRHLKHSLEQPDRIRCILHTPLGPLSIARITGYPGDDVTIVSGLDQQGDLKTYVFNEEQLASCLIELVREDMAKDSPIGFAAGHKVDVVQS